MADIKNYSTDDMKYNEFVLKNRLEENILQAFRELVSFRKNPALKIITNYKYDKYELPLSRSNSSLSYQISGNKSKKSL